MANKKTTPPIPPVGEVIIQRAMEDVMHDSMMPYSEYVILERALPRVEDGLKPVQRRILYTMHELSLTPDKPHRKCARIVGDCLGKYHPHGDTSVYDALARMAQPFVMRGLLVDGHGNFGSIDGDTRPLMRYTEARLTPFRWSCCATFDKDTVSSGQLDDTKRTRCCGPLPNLLVNGRAHRGGPGDQHPAGIPRRGDRAVVAQIDSDSRSRALMRCLPRPISHGGVCEGRRVEDAYEPGAASCRCARVMIEPAARPNAAGDTECPTSAAQLLERSSGCPRRRRRCWRHLRHRDESNRTGMRAVIETKARRRSEKR